MSADIIHADVGSFFKQLRTVDPSNKLIAMMPEVLKENEDKASRLKELGLPTFHVYGKFQTFKEAENAIPEDERKNNEFLIRCTPRHEGVKLERMMGKKWPAIRAFASNFSSEDYTFEVREHWGVDYAGNIIINAGKISIELIPGEHREICSAPQARLTREDFDFSVGSVGFRWKCPKERERLIMLNALRYLVPDLNRERIEAATIYAEFVFRYGSGYRFIDCSTHSFWTQL